MSARLIKSGNHPPAYSIAPLVYKQNEGEQPQATGTVVPFVLKPSSSHPAPRAQAQPETSLGTIKGQPAPERNPAQEAEAIIEEARREARRLLAEAEAGASQIEREAKERGLAETRASVESEITRRVEPLRQQLSQTIEEVAGLREEITMRAERDLVKLAIEIAKKVVHREVTMDSEVALTLARVALTRIHNRVQATLHLHPEDFAYVGKHQDRLGSGLSIELVEDRAISRGGCLIETEMGDTDARIEQQFAELERSFLGV
jgi:flagellar biosynthesis/type III secretory pathway protein FliH